jgi:hypothetical protein
MEVMNTRLLNIFDKSQSQPLLADEIAIAEEALKEYPYFSIPRFILAKTQPEPGLQAIGNLYAPNQALFRAYLGNAKLAEEKPEMPPPEIRSDQVRLHVVPENDFFSILDFGYEMEAEEILPSGSFLSLQAEQPAPSDQTFLNTEVCLRSRKYLGLISRIRAELKAFAMQDESVAPETFPETDGTEEPDPTFDLPFKMDIPARFEMPEPVQNIRLPDLNRKSYFLKDRVIYVKDDRVVEIPVSEAQLSQYFDLEKMKVEESVQSPRRYAERSIIENFLSHFPKESRLKPVTNDREEDFPEDEKEGDEFISETIAELNIRQGNHKEAIRIYRKLSLLFPEKSAYFEARIQKIS